MRLRLLKELGMRSVSQLTAAILNEHQFENKRHFFSQIVNRPDDVAEIFAAIEAFEGKRVRGFGDYLSSLGDYHKMKGKQYNMFDLMLIVSLLINIRLVLLKLLILD